MTDDARLAALEAAKHERDEAVALLRDVAFWIENGDEHFPWDLIDSIPGFLARIDQ